MDIKDAKKALKALGYGVKTKTYSGFIALIVTEGGEAINSRNIYSAETLEKHAAFFAWRAENKGKIFNGMTRVVV